MITSPKSGIRYPRSKFANMWEEYNKRIALEMDEQMLGPTFVPRWKDLFYGPLSGIAEAGIFQKEINDIIDATLPERK